MLSAENCDRVLALIQQDSTMSIRKLSSELNLSNYTIWRILRKKLHMHPYKPKAFVPLTGEHKLARVEFCQWLLEQEDDFCHSVIWSDEKMWEERSRPNK